MERLPDRASDDTHVKDDPLDEVVLALQRTVQQQSQRVELHPHRVIDPLGAGFTEDGPLTLRERTEGGEERGTDTLIIIIIILFICIAPFLQEK